MWCQYRHLWPGGVNWVGCRQRLPLTTDSGSVFTLHNRMVSVTKWEMTRTPDLCLGPSTALDSLNNSCLILASQNPSSARERKIRQGGNHNRDWGRHIRLAQSKSSGYKTLLTSPVVTGITCSKYNILIGHCLKVDWWTFKDTSALCNQIWHTAFHYMINPQSAHGMKENIRKRQHQNTMCQNTHLPAPKMWWFSFDIYILYLPCLAKAPL